VAVTITGDNGCRAEGEYVTAAVNKAGKKRISVSPAGGTSDENGQIEFTIFAKKQAGKAKVTFKAGSLQESILIKVRK
jgi:hypothetical protein